MICGIATVFGLRICVFFPASFHRFGRFGPRTWGFGAFQSKRNCLRDRSGNPNKNVLVYLGGGFFCFVGWRPQRFVFCLWTCIGDIRCWKEPWETLRWHDMSDEVGCDGDLHYSILFSDFLQKLISFAAIASMLCTCSFCILMELCCILELHYPPWN